MNDNDFFMDVTFGLRGTGKTSLMMALSQNLAPAFPIQHWISHADARTPRYARRVIEWKELVRLSQMYDPSLIFVDECQLFLQDGFLDKTAEVCRHTHIASILATQRPQYFRSHAGIRDLSRFFYLFRLVGKAWDWVHDELDLSDEELEELKRLPNLTCMKYDVGKCAVVGRMKVRYQS